MRPSCKGPAHQAVTVLNAMVREPVLSITAGSRHHPRGTAEHADSLVTLGKGTYEIYCPMDSGDHQQRGMHTTLVAEAWSGATGQ